jgi:2-dehydro-3-deoxyglucarate aldolase
MKLSWQQIPSTQITEIMCKGFDGVVLDTEHGCFNNESIFSSIQIIKLKGLKAFVRLTEVNPTLVRYCLDAGCDGLIFSTVETEEQCQAIINACYYPPKGKRGLGLVRENLWGERGGLVSRVPIVVPQIESKAGIDNIQKIRSYGFDFHLIGPYDLSLSLEVPGDFKHEKFQNAIKKMREAIPNDRMAIHIPKDIESWDLWEEEMKEWLDYRKYGMKCIGMDTIALLHYNKVNLSKLNK